LGAYELNNAAVTESPAWQAEKPNPVRKLLICEELGSPTNIYKRIH